MQKRETHPGATLPSLGTTPLFGDFNPLCCFFCRSSSACCSIFALLFLVLFGASRVLSAQRWFQPVVEPFVFLVGAFCSG